MLTAITPQLQLKGKAVPTYIIQACESSGDTDPLILYLSPSWIC